MESRTWVRNTVGGVVAVSALVAGLWGGTAAASGRNHNQIVLKDDCEANSFNAALGRPNACVGNGETTFQQFVAEFARKGSVDDWEFDPDSTRVAANSKLTATNAGGETHTFTKVAQFGGGFVPQLNTPRNTSHLAPECARQIGANPNGTPILIPGPGVLGGSTTFVPAGATRVMDDNQQPMPGTNLYQCCIHPWMHAVVQVETDRSAARQ